MSRMNLVERHEPAYLAPVLQIVRTQGDGDTCLFGLYPESKAFTEERKQQVIERLSPGALTDR